MKELAVLLDEAPDSLYACLQAIEHPEQLPEKTYYDYVLLKVRAKANCDIDISDDTTAIYNAYNYFIRTGNRCGASWSSFYCGRLLRKEKQYDRALDYLLKAEKIADQTDDNRLKGIIQFNIGAVLAEQSSKNEEAMDRFFKASDYFLHSEHNRREQLELENTQLHTHRLLLLLYTILTLFSLGILVLLFYRRSILNKQRAIQAQHTIQELQRMADSYNEKENSFRTSLLHHFNILKKAASLEIYISKENSKHDHHLLKVINEIVYGQETLNWDLLYETMNQLHGGFFERLRERFPQLDESEFRICCLSYAKFSGSEIALIMKLSVNTVQMRRSSIRKKIGVETFGNLADFFNDNLKEEKED